MDIAKYIGLFLLKNGFCYVHGLGNMEVRKLKAAHDGSELQAPSYDVIVTPGGSIDDNLANFIATNEQISISKAANALREFSTDTRKTLTEGGEVEVPAIGKFLEKAGKVSFVTDELFSYKPAGIPTIKNSKQLEEQNRLLSHKPAYPPPASADSVNWSMVILVVVLILVVAGGSFFVYRYMHQEQTAEPIASVVDTPVVQEPLVQETPPIQEVDSTMAEETDTVDAAAVPAAPVIDSTTEGDFTFVIGNYPSRERAEKRVNSLTVNGNKVELAERDSTSFLVLTTIKCRAVDTSHVKDSLRIMFGFRHVAIVR